MSANPSEIAPQAFEHSGTENGLVPERYQESLIHTQNIAGTVGSELKIHPISSVANIPHEPGVYVFSEQVALENFEGIMGAKFDLEPRTLSGKIDSAHAVLPGHLSLLYMDHGKVTETHLSVATKGFYKRGLEDRFDRVDAEVRASHIQRMNGELVFEPIAVVVAPPEYKGNGTDESQYDLLLITGLDERAATLDNAPWQLGFTEENLQLAESATNALGRFNTTVGRHGDAKIKNIAQCPDGQTSMIDFETTVEMDIDDPLSVATTIHEDLGKMLSSMDKVGFFNQEPYRAREVLEQLGQTYLDHWDTSLPEVQESAFQVVTNVVEGRVAEVMRREYGREPIRA